MTIERVLHARGPKMDFYDTDYLTGEGSNPFTVMRDGVLFGYGTELVVGTGKVYLVVNLSKYYADHPGWAIQKEFDDYDDYLVDNPLVPPPDVIVTGGTDYDSTYMDYWLSYYNGSNPRFVCPHKTKWANKIAIVGNDLEFDFQKFVVRDRYTLPIVNGLACYPKLDDGKIRATDGATYCRDMTHRDRMVVLMDFEPVGGCSFYKIKDMPGSLKEFVLPETFDPKTQSLLIVLDGRIVLPEEYTLVSNHVVINPMVLTCIPEIDRKVCTGVILSEDIPQMRTYNNTIIVDGTRDIYNSENSFVVVVNKPNLQIFKHKMQCRTSETHLPQGSSSYAALHRNVFNRNARGLLFDLETRSVYDYAREDQSSTFYAEDEQREITWGSSLVTVNPEDPIVLLAGTWSNNLMSAKAMLFDRARNFRHDDRVVWPNYVILDFIFRG